MDTGITIKNCDHSYDRDKALEYALNWVIKPNPSWNYYKDNNCQNYASQVIYAGGIPMDHFGDANSFLQWKAYSGSYNPVETASGLVYTWTSVSRFANYASNNIGYGICADIDVNIYYAEAGDVIHVGTNGPTRHALVVIGAIKDNNKVIDILVNSNKIIHYHIMFIHILD